MKNNWLCIFLVSGLFVPGFVHARGTGDNVKDLTVLSIRGPAGVGMICLFEEPVQIEGFNVKTEALASVDLMAARLISGEAQAGILPPNMAAKIAASGRDLRVAAVTATGMLSLLSSDPGVRKIEDLKGKTVEVTGQGATSDYVFQRILHAHGLTPGVDISLGYSMAYPEIAQSLIAGRITAAILPEPFATMAFMGKPDLVSVTDIQEEWMQTGGGNFPMTLLVVDGAFADANSGALNKIIEAVRSSIEWVQSHPAQAGVLTEKHGLGLKAAIVAAAIPKSNYVFIPAAEARPSLEALFRVFLEIDPASIGGGLPPDSFYLK